MPTESPQVGALRLTAARDGFTVTGLDAEELATVERDWSRCSPTRVDAAADQGDMDRVAMASLSWDGFHESLVHRMTARAIESGRGTHLLFHAACLADPDTGAAFLLAAASGTGKTTATRRLGAHFAYLTDETAVVDPDDLSITPFPKPLSLLQNGRRPKRQVSPDEIDLLPERPAALRRVAVLDRVREPEGPVEAHAETMPLADALVELVPQTSSLAALDRGLVTLCRTLDRLGGVQRLVYAESDDLRPLLSDLIAAEPTPLEPAWEPLEPAELVGSEESTPDEHAEDEPLVRRTAADCGIELDDGRLVLLHGEQLIMLDGLGALVWLLLAQARTRAGLLASLREFGPVPDDAERVLDTCLSTLAGHGLLGGVHDRS